MSPSLPDSVSLQILNGIAGQLNVQVRQVAAAVQLLDEGASVPFISRYRKEKTGNLDDTQLRLLEERLIYLRDLEERRAVIMKSIAEQGKLEPVLQAAIEAAATKQVLEDLYLPFKLKRRTRAQIAREAGLEPLALDLMTGQREGTWLDPQLEALRYVNGKSIVDGGVPDVKAALDGARDILAERFGENAELLGKLRSRLSSAGVLYSTVVAGKESAEDEKFRDYYSYSEILSTVPSHRALALFRGRALGILGLRLDLPGAAGQPAPVQERHPCEIMIADFFDFADGERALDKWRRETCRWTWRVKVLPHLETELMTQLRESAQTEAIRIFARNLHELLLAAPAGPKVVLGLDPGIRTGCKIAVVDLTGKVLDTSTIYPHEPRRDWEGALNVLATLVKRHGVQLISIGNGTASRETDKLAMELIRRVPEHRLSKVVVSEAGASVYSASAYAAREFPELDVSLRGAVSIARRLQDPLAELVKIDPKAIGVGQYQHDVNQVDLARGLDAVVEDCVNAVGVDINTASAPLLARVSGLNTTLATNIVDYRDAHGRFTNRQHIKKVPRLGEKTFEQCAGFLRINGGDNPLDGSAVHPEAYPVVEKILARIGKGLTDVMGQPEALKGLRPADFSDDQFGIPTVRDIMSELEKPGRDPRPEFKMAVFQEGVEKISDLVPGMLLEGVVTNVAAFGAFVDIGVHQDGLVHISALASKFVRDPHEVVKPGQIVKVKVLEVEIKRQRIALTMRLDDLVGSAPRRESRTEPARAQQRPARADTGMGGAMAQAFAKSQKSK